MVLLQPGDESQITHRAQSLFDIPTEEEILVTPVITHREQYVSYGDGRGVSHQGEGKDIQGIEFHLAIYVSDPGFPFSLSIALLPSPGYPQSQSCKKFYKTEKLSLKALFIPRNHCPFIFQPCREYLVYLSHLQNLTLEKGIRQGQGATPIPKTVASIAVIPK